MGGLLLQTHAEQQTTFSTHCSNPAAILQIIQYKSNKVIIDLIDV